jgi:hypothetical protein
MYERCAACHLKFEREQGYFLGAMYINYAMTVGIVLVGYFVLEWVTDIPLAYHLVLGQRERALSAAAVSPQSWPLAGARLFCDRGRRGAKPTRGVVR